MTSAVPSQQPLQPRGRWRLFASVIITQACERLLNNPTNSDRTEQKSRQGVPGQKTEPGVNVPGKVRGLADPREWGHFDHK